EFPEILDVFVTSRPDALVVVYAGRPHPGRWLAALRAVGYEVPGRRQPNAGVSPVPSVHRVSTPVAARAAATDARPQRADARVHHGSSNPSRARRTAACGG